MASAKIDFLWYKKKEEIKEEDSEFIEDWANKGFVDLEEKKEEKIEELDISELDKKSKERIQDFKEDLEDDGKRNYSNRKKKKSSKKK